MSLLDNFRSNVFRLMDKRKMSLSALARNMGRDYKTVYDILYHSPNVRLKHVEEVCKALKVDPIAMMED